MTDHSAESVWDHSLLSDDLMRVIWVAMESRANREGLWEMRLHEVDMESMAWEIVEAIARHAKREKVLAFDQLKKALAQRYGSPT